MMRRAAREHARNDARAVGPRPAVERLRVAKDGEVVHGHDERQRGPNRTPVRRAVQDVRIVLAAQRERVPDGIAGERRGAVAPAERAPRHLDVVAALELPQERLKVAGGAGARLHERRDVDRGANHSASA